VAEIGTHELIRSMETLLDASAAAAGELVQRLDPDAVDLGEVAQRAVDHVRALTTRHAVTLARPGEPLVVTGDAARLRQVLDNLLANAVKYMPDGGPIDVHLEVGTASLAAPALRGSGDGTSWVQLRVADAGLGIPAADLPHIFDRYRRAAGAARLVRGTGLGLYACRAIVAAHGGHIWVERTAVATESGGEEGNDGWHGTVMAVALPLASSQPLADAGADRGRGALTGAVEG
jgi:signal transduction histidine kinase